MGGQYLGPILAYAIFRITGNISPRNARALLPCLGRQEMFFDTDTSTDYCDGAITWSMSWILCKMADGYVKIITGNIFEIFMMLKSIKVIERQNHEVKKLVSDKEYQRREWYDMIYPI